MKFSVDVLMIHALPYLLGNISSFPTSPGKYSYSFADFGSIFYVQDTLIHFLLVEDDWSYITMTIV